ncbi:unnamed protein product, partial [marine sediment metagenome]
ISTRSTFICRPWNKGIDDAIWLGIIELTKMNPEIETKKMRPAKADTIAAALNFMSCPAIPLLNTPPRFTESKLLIQSAT